MKTTTKQLNINDLIILYAPGTTYLGKFAVTVNNHRYIGYYFEIAGYRAAAEIHNVLKTKKTTDKNILKHINIQLNK